MPEYSDRVLQGIISTLLREAMEEAPVGKNPFTSIQSDFEI
jgi:hypothetical protein